MVLGYVNNDKMVLRMLPWNFHVWHWEAPIFDGRTKCRYDVTHGRVYRMELAK